MNVFVLNTGRCGSTTFIESCKHITNYTSAHESRIAAVGDERLDYPQNHIEADNRLAWFLGRLDRKYGDNATYVHLTRDRRKTAESFVKRFDYGIIRAYSTAIIEWPWKWSDPLGVALDYCDTIDSNIEFFLKDKTRKMPFTLESAKHDFRVFWNAIGAEGDLDAALAEWDVEHNSSAAQKKRLRDPHDISVVRKIARRLTALRPSFRSS